MITYLKERMTTKTKHLKTTKIVIHMKNESAVLDFTSKDQAQMEYNRIKSAGIYCSAWITDIEFIEEPLKQAALLTVKPKKDKAV